MTKDDVIKLVEYLETCGPYSNINCTSVTAATELRRLYAENEALKATQNQQLQQEPIAKIQIKNGRWINTPFANTTNLPNGVHDLYTQSKPQPLTYELYKALEAVLCWIDDWCETTGFEEVEAKADAAINAYKAAHGIKE